MIDVSVEHIATIAMAQEFLGVSRQTLHTWRKKGILPEYRYGVAQRVCFKWADLQKLKKLQTTV
jgi:hypothetical protein